MSPESTAGAKFQRLVEIMAQLRAPGGCPWDREQTHESLKTNTIEEAYEVVEAIDGSDDELSSELGDLLLQVVYHAQIAAEGGRFTAADVARKVTDKMVRRHPHVFGDVAANSPGEVLRNWEAQKVEERAAAGKSSDESLLAGVSTAQPALMEAYQVTTKAGRVGFDWKSAGDALHKIDEEARELKAALAAAPPVHLRVQEEVGDLLFTLVNVARLSGIDPESALKSANRKFRRRFAFVEDALRVRGSSPAQSTIEEMETLWQEAKSREAGPDAPPSSSSRA
jgi:tetrapyrrole methylase family protein / MazG family protein